MPPTTLFLILGYSSKFDYNDKVVILCLIVPLLKICYVESATLNQWHQMSSSPQTLEPIRSFQQIFQFYTVNCAGDMWCFNGFWICIINILCRVTSPFILLPMYTRTFQFLCTTMQMRTKTPTWGDLSSRWKGFIWNLI